MTTAQRLSADKLKLKALQDKHTSCCDSIKRYRQELLDGSLTLGLKDVQVLKEHIDKQLVYEARLSRAIDLLKQEIGV
tara:strand:+ start:85 stop:318 length:234 start_codon:yes stop_codon:yes gene_type:complete